MPRGLSTEIKTAIAAGTVRPVYLLHCDFDGYALRTWTGEGDLSYDSQTWAGDGTLHGMPRVGESAALYADSITIRLKGNPGTAVDLSDPDKYQGRAVEIYVGFYAADGTLPAANIYKIFSGTMSQVEFSSDAESEAWEVIAESRLVDLQRVKSALWTHQEQRGRYPGGAVLTSGLLTIGELYEVTDAGSGADFSGPGGPAAPEVGDRFIATATGVGITWDGAELTSLADNGLAYEAKARAAIALFRDQSIDAPRSRAIIYGQRRVSVPLVFAANSDGANKYLNLVAVVADHECQSIEQVYLDDEALLSGGAVAGGFVGYVDYYSRLGTENQAYIPELETEVTSAIWDEQCRLRGVCYIYLRILYNEELFGDSIPDIKVEVKGKKLYDPRTSSTAYSTNAALAARDYLLAESGFGAGAAEVDDTAFDAAADVCDEAVALAAGGTEPRYRASGVIDSGTNIGENLQMLSEACAGIITYVGGAFRLMAGKWVAPAQTITEADLLEEQEVRNLSRRSWSNGAKGVYVSVDNDWAEESYPSYKNATFVSADGEARDLIYDLPLTNSPAAAQRLAKIAVNDTRRSRSLSLLTRLEFLELICGDVVSVTLDRLGYSAKPFRVESLTFEASGLTLGVRLNLREIASSHYDWNASTEEVQLGSFGNPSTVFYDWANASLVAPSGSPGNQSFSADFSVTVTHNTTGVNCHYTTDGSEPSQASPTVANGGTVTIEHDNQNVALKLKNYETGGSGLSSATVEYVYTANLIADAATATLKTVAVYSGGSLSSAFPLLVFSAPETTRDGSEITLECRGDRVGGEYSDWDEQHNSMNIREDDFPDRSFYRNDGLYWAKYEARTSASGHANKIVSMPQQWFPPLLFMGYNATDDDEYLACGRWGSDDLEMRFRTRPDIPEAEWTPWSAWANTAGAGNLNTDSAGFLNSITGVPFANGKIKLANSGTIYSYQVRVKAFFSGTGSGDYNIAASEPAQIDGSTSA